MAKSKKSSKHGLSRLTGIAGVHYVVSALSRRGLIALPTIRNLAAYDIIVASMDGRKHANIQVKTSSKNAVFWLMPWPEEIRAGSDDYYVFLSRIESGKSYQGFMVNGREVKKEVTSEVRTQERSRKRKKIMPSFHIDRDENKRRRWAKAWEAWTL